MALQNFADKVTTVATTWLNSVDVLLDTVFGTPTTKAQARAALTSDAPMSLGQGGTGATTAGAARTALGAGTTGNAVFIAATPAIGRAALGISNAASVRGLCSNLVITTTGKNANVSVTANELALEDATGGVAVVSSVSLTINTAGTVGQPNSLSTGVLAANTWYYVYVWNNGSTTAGTIDPSSTAPTAPVGYTSGYYARVGAIRTEGGANKYPLPILQIDKTARWAPDTTSNLTTIATIVAGTAAAANVSMSNFMPPTANVALVYASYGGGVNTQTIAPDYSVTRVGMTEYSWSSVSAGAGTQTEVRVPIMTSVATGIGYTSAGAGSAGNNLYASGWEDTI